MKDLHDILKPIAESQKKQMYDLMEEEQALLQEMQYLQEKALLRGKVVSSFEFFLCGCMLKIFVSSLT